MQWSSGTVNSGTMSWTCVVLVCLCALARTQVIPGKSRVNDGDYNSVNTDGSFDFG